MNNKQLQYAIALSKSLNFSQAAEKLGISQPALSKQIAHLEKDLGVTLFERKGGYVELSSAGEYFFCEAKELLYKEEQLYRSMEDFKSGKCGKLVIGISPFRSLYLLPRICKKVKEKYPGVKIVLCEDGSDLIRSKAAEGKYDFAIANLPVDESVLDVIPIEQDTLVLAVPETMLDKLGCPLEEKLGKINFGACKDLSFVVMGQSQEMRQLFEKICSTSGIRPQIAMEVMGLNTAWTMVRAGVGAALLPLQFIESMGCDSNVRLFIPDGVTNIRQPAVIIRRGQHLPEYARYTVELLSGKINEE